MSECRDVAEPRPPSAPRTSRWVPPRTSRSAAARLACLAALVLVPAVLVVLHVVAYPRLSPIDEQMHIDYLSRAPGVQPVVSGTQLGQLAMREEACRGIDSGFTPPPCDSPTLSPAQFELGGYDTAYIHPPTYYSLTAILARGLRSVTGLSSLVTAARLVGALWLATGLLVTYAAGRALGASRAALVGMALLAASLQAVLFFSATVTPDVGSLLVGGLALWLVLLWEKHPSRWWLPPLAGLVAVAIKLQNAAVVLVLVLYLLLRAVRRWRPEGGSSGRLVRSPHLLALLALGAAAVVVAGVWSGLVAAGARVDPNDLPMSALGATHTFPLHGVVLALGGFLPPTDPAYVPAALAAAPALSYAKVTAWVLIAGVVSWAVFAVEANGGAAGGAASSGAVQAGSRLVDLARAVLVVAILGAPLFVVLNYVLYRQYYDVPPRYGMTLLPAMLVLAAAAARRRWAQWTMLGAGVLGVVIMAGSLIRAS